MINNSRYISSALVRDQKERRHVGTIHKMEMSGSSWYVDWLELRVANGVHSFSPFRPVGNYAFRVFCKDRWRIFTHARHIRHLVIASCVWDSRYCTKRTVGRNARRRENHVKTSFEFLVLIPWLRHSHYSRDISVQTGLLYRKVEKLKKMALQ